ncbi:hypothetical protein GOODEAATRI_013603 [Goodea atripinnis]|uniref:Uncharacterized protein n=1 Tax=Goodea atripinnis TaxID=208336 RepID=A0ABV0N1E4_9TELE
MEANRMAPVALRLTSIEGPRLAVAGLKAGATERADESASATFYFHEKTEPDLTQESLPKTSTAAVQDDLVKEWIYYRTLKRGEREFPLRNKQVRDGFLRKVLV